MTDTGELLVVTGERHLASLVAAGQSAETRAALANRLADALLPEVRFVEPVECRLVLGFVLGMHRPRAEQLDLFKPHSPSGRTDAIGSARANGGAAWVHTVAALDHAIGTLRGLGVTPARLLRASTSLGDIDSARARVLAEAMECVDRVLERVEARDSRARGPMLGAAIRRASPEAVAAVIGAVRVRSSGVLAWDRGDLDWWRALDEQLLRLGGWARVTLPAFERPLRSDRTRDPLDELADEVACGLDGAPQSEPIEPVLGDLVGDASEADPRRVQIIACPDRMAQARIAASVVADALRAGATVGGVAVATASADEATLAPLRRALLEEALVVFDGRAPAAARVVDVALDILETAESFDRFAIARILLSGYVDPLRIADGTFRDAAASVQALARRLAGSFTAGGADGAERFVRTAGEGPEQRVARRVVELFSVARDATTRRGRVQAAQTLWDALGVGARAGRGGLRAFGSDAPATGIVGAERAAVVADTRAWEAVVGALGTYDEWTQAAGVAAEPVDSAIFRAELRAVIDRSLVVSAGARVAAVRIATPEELAGETLECLVVADANAGVLAQRDLGDALVSDALRRALVRDGGSGRLGAEQLAALALCAARAKRTTLLFASQDDGGAPLAPSPIIDALARAGIDVRIAAPAPVPVASGDALARARRETVRESFFLDPARPRSDVVGRLEVTPRVRAVLDEATGAGARPLSVTALERFARCGFMGYAHVVLAAREHEERDELPDAREEGTATHEALAAAFDAGGLAWSRRPRDHDRLLADGMAAAERVLTAWHAHAGLRRAARRRVLEAVRAVLDAAIDDDAWDFQSAELHVGDRHAAWPPLLVVDGNERLALKGTLDRLDRAHDGSKYRVVDYKRSEGAARDASAQLGVTALQVPLYAAAVTRRFSAPVSGLYLVTQTRGSRSAQYQTRAAERVEELVRVDPSDRGRLPIEARALEIVTAARRGALEPAPADERTCRTCAFSGGCRKPRFAMLPQDDDE